MIEPPTPSPELAPSPGETIADLLDQHGWTQTEMAERTGFTRKHINDLVKGRASITADTAFRLEAVFGQTAAFWLTREAQYREAVERRQARTALSGDVSWLKELPLAQMVKLGWVRRMRSKEEQVEECLSFFRVASVEVWRRHYGAPLAAFRASPKFEKKVGAVAAWLREGERQATELKCAPWDKEVFRSTLSELRALTNEPEASVFVPRLVEACAAGGVAAVLVPAPTGCPASGATRWLSPEKAMLILSLRHKSNDHLWFTFFHEAAHILLHSKKAQFVDLEQGLRGEYEDEADRFAADWLVPASDAQRLERLGRRGRVSKALVAQFAEEIGVAAGIVVGRMQKEGWLPWSHLNGLKVRYRWVDEIGGSG